MEHNPFQHFTYALHRQFVCNWIQLQAWYAWHLAIHDRLDIAEILERRIYLYSFNFKESQGAWQELKSQIIERYRRQGANPDTDALEAWVLEQDLPYIHRNLPKQFQDGWVRPMSTPYFGFSYEFRPEYDTNHTADFLTLHFRNWFTPDSPLNHQDKLLQGLDSLVADSAIERPDVTDVQCATWVNSLPKFARLFPTSWMHHAVQGAPGNHTGWWGQFMDRTGRLHERNAMLLRKTGEFPHPHLKCKCTIAELREHLRQAMVSSCRPTTVPDAAGSVAARGTQLQSLRTE